MKKDSNFSFSTVLKHAGLLLTISIGMREEHIKFTAALCFSNLG